MKFILISALINILYSATLSFHLKTNAELSADDYNQFFLKQLTFEPKNSIKELVLQKKLFSAKLYETWVVHKQEQLSRRPYIAHIFKYNLDHKFPLRVEHLAQFCKSIIAYNAKMAHLKLKMRALPCVNNTAFQEPIQGGVITYILMDKPKLGERVAKSCSDKKFKISLCRYQLKDFITGWIKSLQYSLENKSGTVVNFLVVPDGFYYGVNPEVRLLSDSQHNITNPVVVHKNKTNNPNQKTQENIRTDQGKPGNMDQSSKEKKKKTKAKKGTTAQQAPGEQKKNNPNPNQAKNDSKNSLPTSALHRFLSSGINLLFGSLNLFGPQDGQPSVSGNGNGNISPNLSQQTPTVAPSPTDSSSQGSNPSTSNLMIPPTQGPPKLVRAERLDGKSFISIPYFKFLSPEDIIPELNNTQIDKNIMEMRIKKIMALLGEYISQLYKGVRRQGAVDMDKKIEDIAAPKVNFLDLYDVYIFLNGKTEKNGAIPDDTYFGMNKDLVNLLTEYPKASTNKEESRKKINLALEKTFYELVYKSMKYDPQSMTQFRTFDDMLLHPFLMTETNTMSIQSDTVKTP